MKKNIQKKLSTYEAGLKLLELLQTLAGETPAASAKRLAKHAVKAMAEDLVASGANLNLKDQYSSTALHYAALYGMTDLALAIIARKPNLDIQNAGGSTAMMHAAWLGHRKIVKALLEAGADPNITDTSGMTAADYMADRNPNDSDAIKKAGIAFKKKRKVLHDFIKSGLPVNAKSLPKETKKLSILPRPKNS